MTARRLALALALTLALASPAPADEERIRGFDVDVQVNADASFVVTEKIAYDFTDSTWKHGIFRDIPVRYGRGAAADYRIKLDVRSVTNGRGDPWPYSVNPWDSGLEGKGGRDLRIKIGDPEKFVNERQDYWITYRVKRGLLYFETHDELYWNVTGNGWEVPIDEASATVYLPEGARPTEAEFPAACFTGVFGSVRSDCEVSRGVQTITFRATRGLQPGEGLTLVLGLPKGVVREPTKLEAALARASDYLSPWLLLPLATFAAMFLRWREKGRDPAGSAAIAVRYAPPEGMTPAEMGLVLDERIDIEDVTSTILDLAVRGWLEIEEIESTKFLFLSNKDYLLRRLKAEDAGLRAHERKLLSALFSGREEVKVSALRNQFYKHLPDIKSALDEEVSKGQGWFAGAPDKVRRSYLVGGLLLLGIAVFGGMFLAVLVGISAGLAIGLSGLIVLGFGRYMPQKTRKGRAAYEEVLGFKEFLERVEADRLERSGGRTADRFEKALPYAVVLGVADRWADAFADIYTDPPKWYRSPSYSGGGFRPNAFVDDLGRSMSTLGQAMASSPSQGGSGGSGFSGGSSGGGFGGGGGGSW